MNRFTVRSLALAARQSWRVFVALIVCSALAAPAEAQKKQKKDLPEGVGSTVSGETNYFDKIVSALPEKGPVAPKVKRRVLVYNRPAGFPHSSIPVGTKTFIMMGDKTGAYLAEASN